MELWEYIIWLSCPISIGIIAFALLEHCWIRMKDGIADRVIEKLKKL